MNLVIGYFYGDKKMQLLNSGPKRDMVEFMESFCLDYVAKIQGNKVNRLDDILKPHGEKLTKKEWDNNIRLWVNKSRNISKYTIKQITKKCGYLYNSYDIDKLLSIYLVECVCCECVMGGVESRNEFDCYDEFDKVIEVIGDPKNKLAYDLE